MVTIGPLMGLRRAWTGGATAITSAGGENLAKADAARPKIMGWLKNINRVLRWLTGNHSCGQTIYATGTMRHVS